MLYGYGEPSVGVHSFTMVMVKEVGATAYNSTYVHRRPCGAARATRRCGAPLRHMALRPGWAQGHVTYVRFVIRNCAKNYPDFKDHYRSWCD